MAVLCLIVVIAFLFVLYVHDIGFPVWVRQPLISQLRANNLAAEFGRLRWRFRRGLVAENLQFFRVGESHGETLTVQEAELQLDWSQAGWGTAPGIRGLVFHGGSLTIPLLSTNRPCPPLIIDQLDARLRFISPEWWELDYLRGKCLDTAFEAAGSLTNASQLQSFRAGPESGYAWKEDLRRLVLYRPNLVFDGVPNLKLAFHFDLRHPEAATADLRLGGAGFHAKFAEVGPFRTDITVNQPPGTNGLMQLFVELAVTNLSTRWAGAPSFRLELDTAQSLTSARLEPFRWTARATAPSSAPASARGLVVRGSTAVTNADGFTTQLTCEVDRLVSTWGTARQATLDLTVTYPFTSSPSTNIPPTLDARLVASDLKSSDGFMSGIVATLSANLDSSVAQANTTNEWWYSWMAQTAFRGEGGQIGKTELPSVTGSVRWQDGHLSILELRCPIFSQLFSLQGDIQPRQRELHLIVDGRVQVPELPPTWTSFASPWLEKFEWDPGHPAVIRATIKGRFPEINPVWTADDWHRELAQCLSVEGGIWLTNLTVRGVLLRSVSLPFEWNYPSGTLPATRIEGPWGALETSGQTDGNKFSMSIYSAVDPVPLASALVPASMPVFERFRFGETPLLKATITGMRNDLHRLLISGNLESRDVTYREERVDALTADFIYQDGWLKAGPVWARQGTNTVQADGIYFNTGNGYLYFTNTVTTVDPVGVFGALGQRTFQSFKPFEFPLPPHVVMNGTIPTVDTHTGADVRFDAEIPSFRWRFLAGTNINATLWWHDGSIIVTNLVGGFHGGRISGNFSADIRDTNDTVLRFDAVVADSQLRSILNDITPQTNRLEGWLDGRLTVVEAHSRTNGPWQGQGTARLRDGFLWDLPLFGGVSKVLDKAVPGLGQTRFNSGSATYILTNRAVVTRDLELRSPTMRLRLNGSVDFDTQLDGKLEATVFRDVPLLGPIVNLVLKPVTKLLEYDIKGRLDHPEMELRYIPNFMLAPLHPVETLRELLLIDRGRLTNAPPVEAKGTVDPSTPPSPK